MQPVLGNPRQTLLANDVLGLLTTSASVKITAGVERYDSNLVYLSELGEYLQPGSSVSSDITAQIHRGCSLVMDSNADFNYLSDYVKPYVTLEDTVTGFSARFNLGVYSLSSPTPDLSLSPGTSTYTGYDLLQVLNQPIGDTYELAAGSEPVAACVSLVRAVFPATATLGFSYEPSGYTTPSIYTWPFDSSTAYTYLEVINMLLVSVGYLPVWVDWDGTFQMHKYVDPNKAANPPEWAFDLTPGVEGNMLTTSRSLYQDVYDVPNTWVYVMNNLSAAPVEGTTQFTYVDRTSPVTSVTARGRVIKKVVFVDAVNFASLLLAAVQGIEADLRPIEVFATSCFPLPLLWHRDIVTYTDPALDDLPPFAAGARRCIVMNWSLPLDAPGGDMALTLAATSAATSGAAG